MRSRTALLAVVALLLLAVGGGALAWVLFLKGDNVAPLALPSTGAAPSQVAAASSSADADPSAEASLAPASGAAIDAASLPGTWTIATGSEAGYRVASGWRACLRTATRSAGRARSPARRLWRPAAAP